MVSGEPSYVGGDLNKVAAHYTYAELLDKMFPYYLSIGMTAAEYWDGENELKRAYRAAYKMRVNEQNFNLWLQGKYIYDAMCCVSPIFNPFSKKKEPFPYTEHPYDLFDDDRKARLEEKKKREYKEVLAKMKARMESWNKQFKNKRKKEG